MRVPQTGGVSLVFFQIDSLNILKLDTLKRKSDKNIEKATNKLWRNRNKLPFTTKLTQN